MSPLPGGRWLFSRLFALMVPYTGTVGLDVLEMAPGRARTRLRDRRRVRNHLASVHAIALCNVGEATTGLAMMTRLPPNARAILVGLEAQYVKKARGLLTAEALCPEVPDAAERDLPLTATIRDQTGETVATVLARWRVGPAR